MRYDYGVGLLASAQGATSRVYHPDGQGHVRLVTDADGQTGATYDYDAFGNLVGQTGALRDDYRYVRLRTTFAPATTTRARAGSWGRTR